jgi:hypothetical protein
MMERAKTTMSDTEFAGLIKQQFQSLPVFGQLSHPLEFFLSK